MPADVGADGGSGSALVSQWTVVTSYLYVYKTQQGSQIDATQQCGYFAKGAKFNGYQTSEGSNWVCISATVSGTYSGTVVDKYAQIYSSTGIAWLEKSGDATTEVEDTSTEYDEESDEETYLSEDFMVMYSAYVDSESYMEGLNNGLDIRDLIGILGIPHQFLPLTDPRIDGGVDNTNDLSNIGRMYTQNIIKRIPLLLITPGVPNFRSNFKKDQYTVMEGYLMNAGISDGDVSALLDGATGKYYTLKFAYDDYFYYVNAMLRSAAIYLEIDDVELMNGRKLGTFNWLYYTTGESGIISTLGSVFEGSTQIYSNDSLYSLLGTYAGCIPFYVDPGNTVDDSFSNSTTTSQLASSMNSLSDTGRELNFLIGNVGVMTNLELVEDTDQGAFGEMLSGLTSQVDGIMGEGNALSNILNKVNTILAGGRLAFPEIWSDSSFGRSYSCSMKLVAGSGCKLSVFLDILVPFYHLLAMSAPRQSDGQSYYSPFLVRCFCQGAFNVDMGIITSLNITRGGDGEWTVDGLPTVANVSFDIKDLYEAFFISPQNEINSGWFRNNGQTETGVGILANITELDYIANSCGVNINDQEVWRTVKMASILGFGTRTRDWLEIGVFGHINQWFNQKINNIFGVF